MASKLVTAAVLTLMGINTITAQAPVSAFHHAGKDDSNLNGLVGQLGQNALLVLLGVVALMGLAWLFCIWNSCVGLNKKQKSTGIPSLQLLLLLAAGITVFSSSCTTLQWSRAADMYPAQPTEGGYCLCHTGYNNRFNYGYAGTYKQYTYNLTSADSGRPFCQQCGRRMYAGNR